MSTRFRKVGGLVVVLLVLVLIVALPRVVTQRSLRIRGTTAQEGSASTVTAAEGPSPELKGAPSTRSTSSGSTVSPTEPSREFRVGGSLIGSIRAEPRSFNPYVATSAGVDAIAFLTQATLVRINRTTDEVEPWLAESWTEIDEHSAVRDRQSSIPTRDFGSTPNRGSTFRLKLREDVTFSDGEPLTAADVLFAFEAVYDQHTASPLGDSLRVSGRPLKVRALGDHEVEIAFPSPYGPGLRILDNLWILPKHKLEPALHAGRLAQAWTPATPVHEIVGLGPFVLSQYRAGERMVFARNPRYWRDDERGRPLPYLDRLTLEIVPDQAAELLRLQSGQLDFTHSEIRAEDYLSLKRAQDEGRVRLIDLGLGLDTDAFWFNLGARHPARGSRESSKPRAESREPRAETRPWLGTEEFRQAVSLAVNRRAYADTVFLSAAEPVHGPITPGNTRWYWPELPGGEYDPARARALFAGLGLTDRNGDGMLEDRAGRSVRFTVLLQRGIAAVERGASFIRDELARVGVGVDVVGLESGAVFGLFEKGEYDAIFHRLLASNTDPAETLDFWLSSGSAHMWNPSQPTPATDWEKQIDELMRQQVATRNRSDRVRLFREVQKILSDHGAIFYFAVPHLYLGTGARLANATPARLRPQLLWSADTLAVHRQ